MVYTFQVYDDESHLNTKCPDIENINIQTITLYAKQLFSHICSVLNQRNDKKFDTKYYQQFRFGRIILVYATKNNKVKIMSEQWNDGKRFYIDVSPFLFKNVQLRIKLSNVTIFCDFCCLGIIYLLGIGSFDEIKFVILFGIYQQFYGQLISD